MRTFQCARGNTLFFENSRCLACGRALGFIAEESRLAGFDAFPGGAADAPEGDIYAACRNRIEFETCNWMVAADSGEVYCRSCRLNDVVPDLSDPRRRRLWYLVEQAKRRLLFSLLELGLPFEVGQDAPPLAFRILADERLDLDRATHVVADWISTGFADGSITLNLLEADPAMREQMRAAVGEPYRTLLGHCRHEAGHYFFWRLVTDQRTAVFRGLFGDERVDYTTRLEAHYEQGPAPDWSTQFVSAYASSHPLEDFAETFAHYLHLYDTLQTAGESGLRLPETDFMTPEAGGAAAFEDNLRQWRELAGVLNQLSRSLGSDDLYPFDIAPPVAAKLTFVHELVHAARTDR